MNRQKGCSNDPEGDHWDSVSATSSDSADEHSCEECEHRAEEAEDLEVFAFEELPRFLLSGAALITAYAGILALVPIAIGRSRW